MAKERLSKYMLDSETAGSEQGVKTATYTLFTKSSSIPVGWIDFWFMAQDLDFASGDETYTFTVDFYDRAAAGWVTKGQLSIYDTDKITVGTTTKYENSIRLWLDNDKTVDSAGDDNNVYTRCTYIDVQIERFRTSAFKVSISRDV